MRTLKKKKRNQNNRRKFVELFDLAFGSFWEACSSPEWLGPLMTIPMIMMMVMIVLLWWFPTTMTKLLRSGWCDMVTNTNAVFWNGITLRPWWLLWSERVATLSRVCDYIPYFDSLAGNRTQSFSLLFHWYTVIKGVPVCIPIKLELHSSLVSWLVWEWGQAGDVVVHIYTREANALIGSTFVHLPRSPTSIGSPLFYDFTRLRNLLTIWSE